MTRRELTRQEPTRREPGESPAIQAARYMVQALVDQGLHHVVLCPGSRSAPLAYALVEAEARGDLALHVRIDERSAAFIALGIAKYRAQPVAVVTTSGTAVANLHPAVVEAHHSHTPLVVVSADRPHELRGVGANQTIDQVGIFGTATRFSADVPAPEGHESEERDLRNLATRAVDAAMGLRSGNPGPVHLNLCYREPLHPVVTGSHAPAVPLGQLPLGHLPHPSPQQGPLQDCDVQTRHSATSGGSHPGLERLWAQGDPARTLVVAGDGASPEVRDVSVQMGWPVLAEPSSGVRGAEFRIPAYRALLSIPELVDDVDFVVVYGRPTLSRPVQRLLARNDVTVIVVAPGGGPWPDAARNASAVVTSLRGSLPGRVPPTGPSLDESSDRQVPHEVSPALESSFLRRWTEAGRVAASFIAQRVSRSQEGDDSEGGLHPWAVAHLVAASVEAGSPLVVGSSSPIRDLDLAMGMAAGTSAEAAHAAVVANRGAAGIDGTVSTAVGVALATGVQAAGVQGAGSWGAGSHGAGLPVTALMGDLTFLHDVGGLLIPAKERGVDLTIVVMNDGGGSIFGALEYGKVAGQSEQAHDVFERVFTTPHRASIAEICAGYGARYTYAPSSDALKNALEKNALGGSAPDESAQRTGERRIHVIEVPVAPELRRTDEVELVDALRASTLTEARC